MNKRAKTKVKVEKNAVELFSGPEKMVGVEGVSLRKAIEDENLKIDKTQFNKDLEKLIYLSAEVRTIARNAVISSAERILQAQKILKKYKKGAFSSWLKMTYGNRQTPYNILNYYKLHHELPKDSQLLFAKMPQKAAYLLGAREGDKEDKVDFIKKYNERNQNELLVLIEEKFPSVISIDRKEKTRGSSIVSSSTFVCSAIGEVKKWRDTKQTLSPQVVKELKEFYDILNQILPNL